MKSIIISLSLIPFCLFSQVKFVSDNIFQTNYFIENKGQFDHEMKGNERIQFHLESEMGRFYFHNNGFVLKLSKIEFDKEDNELSSSKSEAEREAEEHGKVKSQEIRLDWLRSNPLCEIISEAKSQHYFSYGNIEYKSYGYKKIVLKELYPHIDIEYTIPDNGGIHYRILLHPGAKVSDIAFRYSGKKVDIEVLESRLKINNPISDFQETGLKSFQSNGAEVLCVYKNNKKELGFAMPFDQVLEEMEIDPLLSNLTSLTGSALSQNKGFDVDFDNVGNLFVYGGSGGSGNFFKIAKYNTIGSLLWTFMGQVISPSWNSGTLDQASNFIVNKVNNKIYTGQNFVTSGNIIVRIDSNGIYDNFLSIANTNFQECWDMQFNCSNGNVLTLGGGVSSNINIGIINNSGIVTSFNFTKSSSIAQDILSSCVNSDGELFTIIASAFTSMYFHNRIYKPNSALNDTIWSKASGYTSFTEQNNKRYNLSSTFSHGYNCLSVNSNYLFYYDGRNVKAFNSFNGSVIGNPYAYSADTLKSQGGNEANECNFVFLGGRNGNIHVLKFNGTNFIPQPDINIPGQIGKHVYDIKINNTNNQLYVSGEGFVTTIAMNNCDTGLVQFVLTKKCPNQYIASLTNSSSAYTYSYFWRDSITNALVRTKLNTNDTKDTLTATPNKVYKITVRKNLQCNIIEYSKYFKLNDTSYITNHVTKCYGQSYNFNGHIYSTTGIYIDTIVYGFCVDIITTNLTILPILNKTITVNSCANRFYFFNGNNLNVAGTYLDTLVSVNGCDSFLTLQLIVNPITTSSATKYDTICSNKPIFFGKVWRNINGVYTDTLSNYLGCDSIITLNLFVKPITTKSISAAICQNSQYFFNKKFISVSGIYYDTLVSFRNCDSIITLTLSIKPSSIKDVYVNKCFGETYFFNNNLLDSTGIYLDTFTNYLGCDSLLRLNLFINKNNVSLPTNVNTTTCINKPVFFNGIWRNTSGVFKDTMLSFQNCDSFITLNLTVDPIKSSSFNQTICNNQSYLWNGLLQNSTGIYKDTFPTYQNCDSIVTLNLTVNPIKSSSFNQTICGDQNYLWNGVLQNITGIYKDTFPSFQNCDSIVTLNLIVHPIKSSSFNQSICSNQTFLWNGISQNTSGIYKDTFPTYQNCDSIVTLSLTVNPNKSGSFNQTVCSNQSYLWNGMFKNTTGIYKDTFLTFYNCDSIITLNLTVNPIKSSSFSQTICGNQSYFWNGVLQNTSGVYKDTFSTFQNCDSIVTLNLTVSPIKSSSFSQTICSNQVYLWNGVLQNTSGIYKDTFPTYQNCDSIVTLNLTVNPIKSSNFSQTICGNQSYLWNNVMQNTSGVYKDTFPTFQNCDSIVTLNLTVNPIKSSSSSLIICSNQTYLWNGIFQNTTGAYKDTFPTFQNCDSIVTLNLTVNPIKSSSFSHTICSKQSYLWNGIFHNTSGVYKDTFPTYLNCDSIVTLNLKVRTSLNTFKSVQRCNGEQYLFGNRFITKTGIYSDTVKYIDNCDSLISTIDIKFNSKYAINKKVSICPGEKYYAAGSFQTKAGIYVDNLKTMDGCDSIITTEIQLNAHYVFNDMKEICAGDSVYYHNNWYRKSGNYYKAYKASNGCDSIYKLNLEVKPNRIGYLNRRICVGDSIFWSGKYLKITGNYPNTIKMPGSCDSISTLMLDVIQKGNAYLDIVRCKKEGYLFKNKMYFDNTILYDTLKTRDGCDSIVSHYLNIKNCDTSDCLKVYVPTAFSPNGDGVNDNLKPIVKAEKIDMNKFEVFNRWGEKVFDIAEDQDGWNGYYKGSMQPMSSYTWLLNYTCRGKSFQIKGNSTLIR